MYQTEPKGTRIRSIVKYVFHSVIDSNYIEHAHKKKYQRFTKTLFEWCPKYDDTDPTNNSYLDDVYILFSVDNKFMYSKPYFGPDAREIRGVKREKNCTNRCQSDANQDCMTLFLPHHSTCVIIGGT